MAKAKILTFSKKQPFHKFLDELRKVYDEDLSNNFICIYSRDYRKNENDEGFVGRNVSYWFGRSSTECIGLTELMKRQILDFIEEKNQEADE